MYKIRSFWVPAYFRDLLMGGLIRTTSILESQNSFFGRYTSSRFTLVELLFHFDTATDSQRHEQMLNDVDCDTKFPDLKTPFSIEMHAAIEYTMKIFYQVQDEIYNSCFFCIVKIEKQGIKSNTFYKHVLHYIRMNIAFYYYLFALLT